jgi:hypothetical protein
MDLFFLFWFALVTLRPFKSNNPRFRFEVRFAPCFGLFLAIQKKKKKKKKRHWPLRFRMA